MHGDLPYTFVYELPTDGAPAAVDRQCVRVLSAEAVSVDVFGLTTPAPMVLSPDRPTAGPEPEPEATPRQPDPLDPPKSRPIVVRSCWRACRFRPMPRSRWMQAYTYCPQQDFLVGWSTRPLSDDPYGAYGTLVAKTSFKALLAACPPHSAGELVDLAAWDEDRRFNMWRPTDPADEVHLAWRSAKPDFLQPSRVSELWKPVLPAQCYHVIASVGPVPAELQAPEMKTLPDVSAFRDYLGASIWLKQGEHTTRITLNDFVDECTSSATVAGQHPFSLAEAEWVGVIDVKPDVFQAIREALLNPDPQPRAATALPVRQREAAVFCPVSQCTRRQEQLFSPLTSLSD